MSGFVSFDSAAVLMVALMQNQEVWNMTRITTRWLALAVAILAVLGAGLWTFYPRESERSVRIATFSTAIDYAPFLVARANGYFDEELGAVGLKPSYSRFDSLPPLNDALRLNQLDVVFEAEPPAFIAEAGGIDVAVAEISATLTQRIIANPNSGIRSVADLRGKTIGVLTGTSSHYGLLKQLQSAGLSATDVTVVNIGPAEARAAFEAGEIDAWAVWPPFPEHEQLAGRAIEIPSSEAVIQSLVVVDDDFLRTNPKAVRAIDKAVERAKAFIVQNPEAAQRIVAAATSEPIAVVQAAWPKHNFAATLDAGVRSDIDAKAEYLFNEKFVAKRIRPEQDLFLPASKN